MSEEASENEIERLWAEEVERRLASFRAGQAQTTPAEEVHRKAEKLLADLEKTS